MPAPIVIHHQHLVPVNMGTPFYTTMPIQHQVSPIISPIYSPPSPTMSVCSQPPPANYNMILNYSMELVWHGEFNRLFQNFMPSQWYLNPTFSLPKGCKWTMFKDSAKVRFLCQECSHGWTSMKGRVVFWFTFDEQRNVGMVLFRLFGQRCQSCSPKLFEHAMWYPEEVVKVVGNIFNRIGQEYYGFYSPPVRIDRRAGKPRSQHNATLCQACSEGICPGEFDESVETFGLYRKTSTTPSSGPRSYSNSISSQYSTDVSSIASSESLLSADEMTSSITSEIAYDESHSDTTSEVSVDILTADLANVTIDTQTVAESAENRSAEEDAVLESALEVANTQELD